MFPIDQVRNLLPEYCDWLQQNTHLRDIDGVVEITTPYLDRHNDCIQIYVKPVGLEKFILTDDGYTIEDLKMSGVKIDTPERNAMLNVILKGFGVQSNKNALEIEATPKDFPLKKHSLLQAILAVNDLYYLASPECRGTVDKRKSAMS